MKFLNIDNLAEPQRTLTLFGKAYKVVGINVKNFIEVTKEAQEMSQELSIPEQVSKMVDLVCRCIPDLSRETAEQMNLDQLGLVVQFVRGDLDDKAEDSVAESSEAIELKDEAGNE